jgi:hypothetical protein
MLDGLMLFFFFMLSVFMLNVNQGEPKIVYYLEQLLNVHNCARKFGYELTWS